jgi:hypothetical protein
MKNVFNLLVAAILVVLCTACSFNNIDDFVISFLMFLAVLLISLLLYLRFNTNIIKMAKKLIKKIKDKINNKKEKDLQISLNNLKKENLDLVKNNQSLHNENIDLGKQIDDKNQKIKELKVEIANKPAIYPQNITQPTEKYWQNTKPAGKYFFAELMLTAGPRKNFNKNIRNGDYDLGEDVAGFIIKDDKTFFWVLDGTSDSDIISRSVNGEDLILKTDDQRQEEYFSSRWLAQSIGLALQEELQNLDNEYNSKNILQKVLKKVPQNWSTKIENLPLLEREKIKTIIANRSQLRCSTTVIFGTLSLSGNLDVCQIGDSNLIASPTQQPISKSKGRLFAQLTLDEETKQIILRLSNFEDTAYINYTEKGIKTVLAMTDGISNNVVSWLQAQREIDFQNPQIRTVLAQQKQKTDDDKAFCVIQIKE